MKYLIAIWFCVQEGAKELQVSLFIYIALDGEGQIMADVESERLSSVVGRSPALGDFRLVFPKSLSKARYNYLVSYTSGLDRVQETLVKALRIYSTKSKTSPAKHYIGLSGKAMPDGMSESRANLIVYQVS